jgi:hypothetical protein
MGRRQRTRILLRSCGLLSSSAIVRSHVRAAAIVAADVSAVAIMRTHIGGASCMCSDIDGSRRCAAMSNVGPMRRRSGVRDRWRGDDSGRSHSRRSSNRSRRRRESNVANLPADKGNSPPQFRCFREIESSGASFRASQREAQRLRKFARRVMGFADQRFGNIGNTDVYPRLAEIKRPVERQRLRRSRWRRRGATRQNDAGKKNNK